MIGRLWANGEGSEEEGEGEREEGVGGGRTRDVCIVPWLGW